MISRKFCSWARASTQAWIWYGLVVLAVWQLGTFAVHVALLSLRVPGEVHTHPRERSAAPASTTSERKCYPVTLAFRGVHYYVPDPTDKSQELHLLNQASASERALVAQQFFPVVDLGHLRVCSSRYTGRSTFDGES